ncbi:MAG: hypothetical protein PUD39_07440 [Bacteroidales bacterium]|nr:hypothetical protein [Bacteroidales bacterium]
MKNVFKIMLVVLALCAFTIPANAQQRKNGKRPSTEQLAEKQAKHIAQELCLDDETTAKFIATYTQCQKEIMASNPRKRFDKKQSRTEAQTDSLLRARFDHSQRLLDLRKKYYEEYRKFLTAKQIERVYQIEDQTMKRLTERMQKRHQANKNRNKADNGSKDKANDKADKADSDK